MLFGELIDQVVGQLHGHTTDQPALGTLTAGVTATDTELTIDFGDQPGAARPNGLVEIGRELLAVTRFDPSTGVATLGPWGRGQRGTVAAAHDAGSMVTVRPRYPRAHVARTLNQVIAGSCPPLFAPRDLAPIATGEDVALGYPLPDDTVRVLRVDATDAGPEFLADRRVVRDWRVRTVAGQQLLELADWEIDQTIQVTIAASPGLLVDDADDYAAVTGLPEATADLMVMGAIARLILGGELARQQLTSVEAAQRNQQIPAGSGATVARFYQALYTQRLEAERDRLAHTYPLQLLKRL